MIGGRENNALCRDLISPGYPLSARIRSVFLLLRLSVLGRSQISIRIHAALGWSILKICHSRIVEPDYITVVRFRHDFAFELGLE